MCIYISFKQLHSEVPANGENFALLENSRDCADETWRLIDSGQKVSGKSTACDAFHTLKGPLSVTIACSIALVALMIVEHNAPEFRQNLEANLLITTVIVVMDFGTSEAIYFMTALRFLGSLTGIALGLLIQAFEIALISYRHSPLNLTGNIALRLLTLTPPIFACVYYMKKYPRYMTVFLLTAIHCPAVVLSNRSQGAVSVVIGTVFGSCTAILTWMIFDRSSSESYLKKSCAKTTLDILSLLQVGLDRSTIEPTSINRLKEEIQANIHNGKQAYNQYATWRSWLCSHTTHDFDPIYDRLRDLFFRASLLAVEESSDETLLYFHGIIGAPLKCINSSLERSKTRLHMIFDEEIDFVYRSRILGDLIQEDFQDGIILNFESLSDAAELFGVEEFRTRKYVLELHLAVEGFGRLIEAITESILDIPDRDSAKSKIYDSLRFLSRGKNTSTPQ